MLRMNKSMNHEKMTTAETMTAPAEVEAAVAAYRFLKSKEKVKK